jgi:hypothetical protein
MPAATRINRLALRRALIATAVLVTSAVAALAVAAPASAAIVSTTTTVSLSNNDVALNQPVTMTATVTAALGTVSPTGTVTFQSVATDGTTTTIGSANLTGSGLGSSQASLTTSSIPGGSYQIVAKYTGAFLTFSASTSAPVQLTVAGAVLHNTQTTLSADKTVITAGDSATFTAVVSETDGVLVPTGTVTFTAMNGGVQSLLGQSDLDGSGTATLTVGGWQAGTYTIVAQYIGDKFDKGSSARLTFGVNPGATQTLTTTTTVALDPGSIQTNGLVNITATVVQSRAGAIPPAGDHVNFYATAAGSSQAVFLGAGDVTWTADGTHPASGVATLAVSGWQAGQYTITAQFIGDIYDDASSGYALLGVTSQAPTSLPYTGDTTKAFGSPANVSFKLVDGGGSPLAAEAVTITINGQDYPAVTDSSGTAAIQVSLPVGTYPATAAFTGDGAYLASTGAGTLTITPTPTSLTYTGDTSVLAGSPATVSFVLRDGSGNVLSNRPVSVTIDGQTQALTSDANGNVSFVVTKPGGTYPITASYAGDANFLSSAGTGTLIVQQLPTSLAYTGDTSVNAGSPATVSFVLEDNNGNALASSSVSVTIDGQTQTLTTDANGKVSFTVTKPGGSYPITASYGGTTLYLPSTGSGSLTVNKIPTTTTYTGDTTAGAGTTATLSAKLVDVNGNPLSGKTVTLGFGQSSCTATTNASGVATCTVTVVDGPGSYPITASFAGDGVYLASSGPSTMTVTGKSATAIVDNVTGTFLQGSSLTLSGTLTANGSPLAGKTVKLTFGSTSCTGTTNASGVATCGITVPGPTGTTTTTATFAGDAAYKSATDTKPALVYAYAPGGGSFVVGDQTDTGSVYFWGSQWWKQNSLSHGDPQAGDPAAFKGFAAHPGTPQCGVDWSTDPGNSTPPPSGPLPAYMAVIVTDHNSKSGPVLSGDTVAIVIVKTDSGYQGNPGHAGTGTVVATLCTGTAYAGNDGGSGNNGGSGGNNGGSGGGDNSGSGSGGGVTCSSSDKDEHDSGQGKSSKPKGHDDKVKGKGDNGTDGSGHDSGVKCESLLANLSVSSGDKVSAGQTISVLYADDSKLADAAVTLDGNSLDTTVTTTSGVKPNYLDSYGGSASTKYESLISFKIPKSGCASGTHTVTITVQDGDGDYDVYSFTVKL